jgi:hypothetical protein
MMQWGSEFHFAPQLLFQLLRFPFFRLYGVMQLIENRGSRYFSTIEFLSHLRTQPFHQSIKLLISRLFPLLWSLYIFNFRFLDLFKPFHGWLPSLERPPQLVFSNLGIVTNRKRSRFKLVWDGLLYLWEYYWLWNKLQSTE